MIERPPLSSERPGRPTPGALAAAARLVRPLVRALWPADVTGLHNLPNHDAYVVVANHSGLGTVEVLALLDVWITHVGEQRPMAAMVHPGMLRTPGLGAMLRSAGCVEATREGAAWARARGAALLLFPGGDHESMRPFWRHREVDFAGRTGWVRLARDLGLVVVPLAITGSHHTAPTLGYSRVLAYLTGARLLGIRRIPFAVSSIVAASVSLAWSRGSPMPRRVLRATIAYLLATTIPILPARLGFFFLEPVEVASRTDSDAYRHVISVLEDVLRRAPAKRPS